jgi:hypothetical protein
MTEINNGLKTCPLVDRVTDHHARSDRHRHSSEEGSPARPQKDDQPKRFAGVTMLGMGSVDRAFEKHEEGLEEQEVAHSDQDELGDCGVSVSREAREGNSAHCAGSSETPCGSQRWATSERLSRDMVIWGAGPPRYLYALSRPSPQELLVAMIARMINMASRQPKKSTMRYRSHVRCFGTMIRQSTTDTVRLYCEQLVSAQWGFAIPATFEAETWRVTPTSTMKTMLGARSRWDGKPPVKLMFERVS